MEEGLVQIRIIAEDNFDEITIKIIDIYKDTQAPEIIINSPNPHEYLNSSPIINAVFYDLNNDSLWYRVWQESAWKSGKVMLSNNTDQLMDQNIWDNQLSEGSFRIYFYANDTMGHLSLPKSINLFKDTIYPILVIISPENNTFYNSRPMIQVDVYDVNFDKLWYEVNGQIEFLQDNQDILLAESIWINLPDETDFIIKFFANDSAGNLNNSIQLSFYKDIISPRITILSPEMNDVFSSEYFNFNLSIDDLNLKEVCYSVYTTEAGWSSNITVNLEQLFGEIDNGIWDSCQNGTIYLKFYAKDGNGNTHYEQVKIFKDTIAPSIQLLNLKDYQKVKFPPDFSINIQEAFLESTWYILINATNPSDFTENYTFQYPDENTILNIYWNQFDEGDIIIRFYARDLVGHINSSEVIVTKDESAPDISLISPEYFDYYSILPPSFNITKGGDDINRTWYYLSNSDYSYNTEYYFFEGTIGNISQDAWNQFGEEGIIITFGINDSLDNRNWDSVYLIKDTITPLMIINDPFNKTKHSSRPIMNITVFDENLDDLWYMINGQEASLYNNSERLLDHLIWNSLPDECIFTIHFFAKDKAGNLNDSFSYTLYKDIIEPRLIINNPNDNYAYNSRPIINVLVHEMNFESLWYEINGETVCFPNNTDQLLNVDIWNIFADESEFIVDFYANDSLGHTKSISYTIYKDTIAPRLTIHNPINNSGYKTLPSIMVDAYDLKFEQLWYVLNGQTKFLQNNTEINLDQSIWNIFSEEQKIILNFYANDSLGHTKSISYTIYKDTIAPRLFVSSPINNTAWDQPLYLDVIVFDLTLENIFYSVNDFVIALENNTNTQIDLNLWYNLTEGDYKLWINTTDLAGNTNFTVIYFIYSKQLPLKPFNILDVLFGSSGLIFPILSAGIMVPVSFFVTRTRYYRSLSKQEKQKTKHILILAALLLGTIVLFYLV
jgi:hypothetical protein